MQQLILMFHVLIALALIVLVLLQQGKGAEMGAAFGSGASQTLFGSQGSGSFLLKVTAILAALFFSTSLLLGHFTAQQMKQDPLRAITKAAKNMPIPATPAQSIPNNNSSVPVPAGMEESSPAPAIPPIHQQ